MLLYQKLQPITVTLLSVSNGRNMTSFARGMRLAASEMLSPKLVEGLLDKKGEKFIFHNLYSQLVEAAAMVSVIKAIQSSDTAVKIALSKMVDVFSPDSKALLEYSNELPLGPLALGHVRHLSKIYHIGRKLYIPFAMTPEMVKASVETMIHLQETVFSVGIRFSRVAVPAAEISSSLSELLSLTRDDTPTGNESLYLSEISDELIVSRSVFNSPYLNDSVYPKNAIHTFNDWYSTYLVEATAMEQAQINSGYQEMKAILSNVKDKVGGQ